METYCTLVTHDVEFFNLRPSLVWPKLDREFPLASSTYESSSRTDGKGTWGSAMFVHRLVSSIATVSASRMSRLSLHFIVALPTSVSAAKHFFTKKADSALATLPRCVRTNGWRMAHPLNGNNKSVPAETDAPSKSAVGCQ